MTTPTVRVVSSACLIGALLASGQALVGQTRPSAPQAQTQKPPVPTGQAGQGGQTTEQPTPPKGEPGAKATGPFTLSVDSIMQGPKLVGYPPAGLRWSGDSQRLYFEWRQPKDEETSTWVVAREGGQPRKLTDDERKLAPPTAGGGGGGGGFGGGAGGPQWDDAHRRVLAVQDGDIVLLDTVAQTRRALTKTTAGEGNPRWAKGETHVTFTRENSLYLLSLTDKGDGLVQLTDAGLRRPDPKPTASQQFLKDEEKALIEAVREESDKEKRAEEKKKREALPRIDITERQSVADLALAHGDAYVYALVVERAQNAKRAIVPDYVTVSGYTEDLPARIKVGDAQDTRRLAIVNLKTKALTWASLDVPGGTSPAPQTTEPKPGAGGPSAANDDDQTGQGGGRGQGQSQGQGQGAGQSGDQGGDAAASKVPPGRVLRWSMPELSPDGSLAVATVRSADNNDRWLVAIDPASGKTRVLDHLRDEAWVREGASSGWLPDGKKYWYLSEADGWMHLYSVDASSPGASPKQLTTGKWELASVDLSPDKSKFYLTSTEAHPGERHVYTMSTDGGARAKLTSMVGSSNAEVSPDGKMLGVLYSAATKPPEVYLMANEAGAKMTQVTTSTSDAWRSYKWVDGQLLTFAARDGAQVYARLYTPEMVGAKRHPSAPGVVFVHGAGYLQNAHKYWSSYFREYMFHHLLASKGYVVLDVDYRASAGYGRDWRTAIYRHMGGKDLEDIVDGANFLVKSHKVNAKHIGVYGGSYGGFITLMAMFTTPDVFAAGAALRPVTDWAHYNHPYTSNILNEPQEDAEAYRRSSPIYFADKLKGALLICHGMVDVNVHFQDSVRLAQRLIELRKENWELAAYPVEDHGFEKETSWADEYKRILKLYEENLKK
jgi:dipeptidyl aminopeptidase/acylaminoacyl peptidase